MHQGVDLSSPAIRFNTFLLELLPPFCDSLANKESLEISTTIFFFKCFLPVLLLVKVVDDDTNKHIHDEKCSANHKTDEVDDHARMSILFLDHVNSNSIDTCVHDSGPTLSCCKDEEGSHCLNDIVKVTVTISPVKSSINAILLGNNPWSIL